MKPTFRRHRLRIVAHWLAACVLIAILEGCEAAQVANRTINQSSYLPDLQYRQIIDNLAIIADNPSALPYFNTPNTSKTTIQRTAQTNFGLQWGLFAAVQHVKNLGMAPLSTMVTKSYEPLVLSQIVPGAQGTQQSVEEWDTALSLDPVRSVVMQGLYRKVLGFPCTPFQLRLLQKFFYDYPNNDFNDASMLFPDGLTPPYLLAQELSDRQNSLKARVAAAINSNTPLPAASATEALPAVASPAPTNAGTDGGALGTTGPLNKKEQPTGGTMNPDLRNAFKNDETEILGLLCKFPTRNASQELTKKRAIELVNDVVNKCDPAISNEKLQDALTLATEVIYDLTQQVLLQRPIRERGDTYANYNAEFRELYHSLQPGWLGKGSKSDVPKDACYVGHRGKTYVWVTADHLEQLTNLTVAILDAATAATGAASLATNPISGGPPSLPTASGGSTPKSKTGEVAPSSFPSMLYAPAARDRFNITPPPGPNIVPAPPASGGMMR